MEKYARKICHDELTLSIWTNGTKWVCYSKIDENLYVDNQKVVVWNPGDGIELVDYVYYTET